MYAEFGQIGGERPETRWTPATKTATVAGVTILVAILAIAGLRRANVCPKLQREYTDNWLKYGSDLAEWTKRQAVDRGCKWAIDPPRVNMADQGW